MIEYLKPLIDKSLQRTYPAGSIILYQGEAPRSAFILASGVVRVYSISSQGEEQIVMFHVAGDLFPSAWLFEKSSTTTFFYEALTNCTLALVPKSELKDTLFGSQQHTKGLVDYLANSYTATLIRINALQQPKARDKLIYTLYYLFQCYGSPSGSSDFVQIPISLTHQNFASLVGLTRETTAIEMNKLKKQKIITYKQQHYSVNPKKLLEIMGEDSFSNIEID